MAKKPWTYDPDKVTATFNGEKIEGWSSGEFIRYEPDSLRWARWIGEWVTAWDLIGMEVGMRNLRPQEPCWGVLGLQPGASERDIKRAYARLVRVHSPEGDPEAFQRVRLAYEEALRPRVLGDDFGDDVVVYRPPE